ncbi:hypothetical protein I3760_11G115200 [Carya illinoinensis]|uniref:RING-type E3 ubiquitin transferase n=1 Tax=Carya illinoinensis TaxID=32201 RepID=A0A922DPC1_CARIL|nr:hypothetical protein I3760_11G115200 [Carya illinoinensis]KAG6688291.1 hypothetical protein I3842_11G116800 [Carya illinoinensis]
MGFPQTPDPHLSQAVQLKLYQAFIFSIPILFSIILLLLFYLFYLKRRSSSLSSPPPMLPTSSNPASSFASPCQVGLKGNIKEKLSPILFEEELRTRESQCSVCLGEFEIKEELLQIPLCKHVFHIECIHLWLHSNSTCPLCRCLVIPTKLHNPPDPPSISEPLQQDSTTSNHTPSTQSSEQQQQQQQQQQEDGAMSNIPNLSRDHSLIAIE